jgi:S-adenosylmethionine-diacylglycerol 3-amino-3-carboxypropyl transferase
LTFLGKLTYSHGFPSEAQPSIFQAAKAALTTTQINYYLGDILQCIQNSTEKINFISFSNAPSYFRGETSLRYLQAIHPYLSKDATIVVRNFLNEPDSLCTAGFVSEMEKFRNLIHQEKCQFYDVKVYRRLEC